MDYVSIGVLLMNKATEENEKKKKNEGTHLHADAISNRSAHSTAAEAHEQRYIDYFNRHIAVGGDGGAERGAGGREGEENSGRQDVKLQEREEEKAVHGTVVHVSHQPLNPHADLRKDHTPLRSYYRSLFYPEVYMPVFYALRVTLLVGLPLGFLARYPKTMAVFPAHVIMPLYGVVSTQLYVGDQVAFWITCMQAAIWFMLWGTFNNVMNTMYHTSAWWCTMLFGIFVVSLFGDVRCKRLCVLTTSLIMAMQHLPGGESLLFPCRVCRDIVICTTFGLLQAFVPPRTVARQCDDLMAKWWAHYSTVMRAAVTACWSDDPIEATVALSRITMEPFKQLHTALPQRLFFVMYEFWESTLRLELRRERLELLCQFRPAIHALTGIVRVILVKRPFTVEEKEDDAPSEEKERQEARAQEEEVEPVYTPAEAAPSGDRAPCSSRETESQRHAPYGRHSDNKSTEGAEVRGLAKGEEANEEEGVPEYYQVVRRSVSDLFEVAPPSKNSTFDAVSQKKNEVTASPPQQHGSTPSGSAHEPRGEAGHPIHWSKAKKIVLPDLLHFLDAFDAVTTALRQHLAPKEVTAHVPFQQLREATERLHRALNKLRFELLVRKNGPVDPILYTSTMFFHMTLIHMAEGLLRYGERMRNFDRRRYKSAWRRFFEFFFLDYWNAFWEDLPSRLTIATPRDVRIIQDSMKMALAYTVGTVYTIQMDTENAYYFGMAILMCVGWPTAGDTMVASVYRVTGMVIACSIAYVAVWHTPNLAGELAIALAGLFISQLFRDVMPYAHTANYCSMLVLTALGSAENKMALLSRIVSNSFTVVTYYAICIFLFPIDVLRVTYNSQVRSVMFVTDTFSQLVRLMQVPVDTTDRDERDAVLRGLKLLAAERTKGWKTITTLGSWLPKAAAEPTLHGQPYPTHEMTKVYSSLRRLASAVDIVYSALSNLYQPHPSGFDAHLVELMRTITPIMLKMDANVRIVMQDFIDAFAVPLSWSAQTATKNFTAFLKIHNNLHEAYLATYKQLERAFRHQFRESVVSRTLQRAAEQHLITADFANRFQDRPRRNASSDSARCDAGPRKDDPLTAFQDENCDKTSPTASALRPPLTGASLAQALEPLERQAEADTYEEFVNQHENFFFVPAPATHIHLHAPGTNTADHVTATATSDGRTTTATGVDPYAASAVPNIANNNNNNNEKNDVTGGRTEEQEQKQQKQPEHSIADVFVAQNNFPPFVPLSSISKYGSVGVDMEMITSLMVAADMFFAESERLLRTMYKLNAYSRSRDGPPVKVSPYEV